MQLTSKQEIMKLSKIFNAKRIVEILFDALYLH